MDNFVGPFVLEGVVAYVEVRAENEDRSRGIAQEMTDLGATISEKLTREVTHVIFRNGTKRTKDWAERHGVPLVTVGWLKACRDYKTHLPARYYRVRFDELDNRGSGELDTLFPTELRADTKFGQPKRRQRFMEPRDMETELARSAERKQRAQKRHAKRDALRRKVLEADRELQICQAGEGGLLEDGDASRADCGLSRACAGFEMKWKDTYYANAKIVVPTTPPGMKAFRERMEKKKRGEITTDVSSEEDISSNIETTKSFAKSTDISVPRSPSLCPTEGKGTPVTKVSGFLHKRPAVCSLISSSDSDSEFEAVFSPANLRSVYKSSTSNNLIQKSFISKTKIQPLVTPTRALCSLSSASSDSDFEAVFSPKIAACSLQKTNTRNSCTTKTVMKSPVKNVTSSNLIVSNDDKSDSDDSIFSAPQSDHRSTVSISDQPKSPVIGSSTLLSPRGVCSSPQIKRTGGLLFLANKALSVASSHEDWVSSDNSDVESYKIKVDVDKGSQNELPKQIVFHKSPSKDVTTNDHLPNWVLDRMPRPPSLSNHPITPKTSSFTKSVLPYEIISDSESDSCSSYQPPTKTASIPGDELHPVPPLSSPTCRPTIQPPSGCSTESSVRDFVGFLTKSQTAFCNEYSAPPSGMNSQLSSTSRDSSYWAAVPGHMFAPTPKQKTCFISPAKQPKSDSLHSSAVSMSYLSSLIPFSRKQISQLTPAAKNIPLSSNVSSKSPKVNLVFVPSSDEESSSNQHPAPESPDSQSVTDFSSLLTNSQHRRISRKLCALADLKSKQSNSDGTPAPDKTIGTSPFVTPGKMFSASSSVNKVITCPSDTPNSSNLSTEVDFEQLCRNRNITPRSINRRTRKVRSSISNNMATVNNTHLDSNSNSCDTLLSPNDKSSNHELESSDVISLFNLDKNGNHLPASCDHPHLSNSSQPPSTSQNKHVLRNLSNVCDVMLPSDSASQPMADNGNAQNEGAAKLQNSQKSNILPKFKSVSESVSLATPYSTASTSSLHSYVELSNTITKRRDSLDDFKINKRNSPFVKKKYKTTKSNRLTSESTKSSQSSVGCVENDIQKVISITSLHRNERLAVEKAIATLPNCRLAKSVTEDTTHLVTCSPVRRTVNFLRAFLLPHCYLVTMDWVKDSAKAEKWLRVTPKYQITETPSVDEIEACRNLFSDYDSFYIADNVQPPKADLIELIEKTGGLED